MIIHITSRIDSSLIGVVPNLLLATHISIVALINHISRKLYVVGTLLVIVEHVSRCRIHSRSRILLIPISTRIEYFIMVLRL